MKVINISVLYPTENTGIPWHQKVPFMLCYFSKKSVMSTVLLPEALGFARRWESSVEWLSYVHRLSLCGITSPGYSKVNVMISSDLGPILNISQILCGFLISLLFSYSYANVLCPATLAHPVLHFAWKKAKYFPFTKNRVISWCLLTEAQFNIKGSICLPWIWH